MTAATSIFLNKSRKMTAFSFDYKVKSGPALSRNAIALLKVMGYPETIVQDAYAAANDFDQNRKWQDL